ncbi:phosphoribosyltransferase [Anaeromyxobacter oryzae]|uniref:Phosphoribosyltransferase n=1 Tax=Anaeromyxobacter oryzae TaxID=2918170 RepID=A0ABM7WU27_9BACT|nr:phosphoribosyltransferase family protein [Anaeromyxobacter oryzae]BDG03003.1 phosphoribosyltransferase [Anaeromyxobacter oryzae]
MIFQDREHAGRLLAARLEHLRAEEPVVFGLARGGLPVAREVSRALGAPLDLLVVRKLATPGAPECAIGAISEAGAVFVDRALVAELGVTDEEVADIAEQAGRELARRVRAYRGEVLPIAVAGRTVIVVDDGVATGATARAAGLAVRRWGAARVVLAAPVIAAVSLDELRRHFDEVIAVEEPPDFLAVSWWYRRFTQVSDAEVLDCLRDARAPDAASVS